MRNAFNTIKDFEQANVNLSTILGVNVSQMEALTKEAERLGGTTRYTASEVTGLQTELAKLGFNQKQILAMEEGVLNFATAVGAELPESAALAGAVLRMFGLQASDTEDVLGTLALATNKSALSFSYFQTAMSIVGPVARTFGFSVKDTTALLGALANAGFDASSAATATRNIILNLANANGKLAKALGEPVSTFPELMDGLKKLNDRGVDLATTLELTDKRSVAAFNAFLSGVDSTKALRDEFEDTGGVLQDIADTRMNTVEGSILTLKSAWERLILSLKNSRGVIKQTIDLMTDLVKAMTPGEDVDPEETGRRTSSYVNSLWNIYSGKENSTDLILKAIAEDEEKMEKGLKNAEAKLSSASGIIHKRRAKKEIQYYKEGLAAIAGAREELQGRMKWEAGTYYGDKTVTGDDAITGDDTGGDDGGKKSKQHYSLQSDEKYLTARAELMRQFNEGLITSESDYNERLYQLEVSSLQARLALHKDSGADRLKIESDLQQKIMDHKKKADAEAKKKQEEDAKLQAEAAKLVSSLESDKTKAAVAGEEERYRKEVESFQKVKSAIANQDAVLEAMEKRHQVNLAKIQVDAQNEALQRDAKEHQAERDRLTAYYTAELATVSANSGRAKELQKEMQRELLKEDERYLKELGSNLQAIIDTGTLGGIQLSEEQINAFKQQLASIDSQIATTLNSLKGSEGGAWQGTGGATLFGVSGAEWELMFKHLDDGTLKTERLASVFTAIGGAAQEGFKIAQKAVQLTNAKEKKAFDDWTKDNDKKKKALQDRLDAGLLSQAQYEEELAQMEQEAADKEAEMNLEQAKRAKTLSIVESIINTAVAATKALAQGGMPAGPIMAGVITALGAVQTAMIAAQPVGYAEGGPFGDEKYPVKRKQDGKTFEARLSPDKRGFVSQPTVLVGEAGTEYVIPHEALENPDILPFVNTIETARRNGSLKSLRLEAVSPAAAIVEGRASGGFTGTATEAPSLANASSATLSPEILQKMNALLGDLQKTLSKPIQAEVAMLGRRGIVEKQEEYARLKSKGGLK